MAFWAKPKTAEGLTERLERKAPDKNRRKTLACRDTAKKQKGDQSVKKYDITQPIVLKKGVYNQKVIICRPNVVLVGEYRESTIITLA